MPSVYLYEIFSQNYLLFAIFSVGKYCMNTTSLGNTNKDPLVGVYVGVYVVL